MYMFTFGDLSFVLGTEIIGAERDQESWEKDGWSNFLFRASLIMQLKFPYFIRVQTNVAIPFCTLVLIRFVLFFFLPYMAFSFLMANRYEKCIQIENNIGNRRNDSFGFHHWWILLFCTFFCFSHSSRLLCTTFMQLFACSFFPLCCLQNWARNRQTKKKMTQLNVSCKHTSIQRAIQSSSSTTSRDDFVLSHSFELLLSGISSLLFLYAFFPFATCARPPQRVKEMELKCLCAVQHTCIGFEFGRKEVEWKCHNDWYTRYTCIAFSYALRLDYNFALSVCLSIMFLFPVC